MCVRVAVNMLLRAEARGPGVWAEGGGGAGDGERLSVAVVVAMLVGAVSIRCLVMTDDPTDPFLAIYR